MRPLVRSCQRFDGDSWKSCFNCIPELRRRAVEPKLLRMANSTLTLFGKLTDPAYLGICIVVGMGPIVIPAPYGFIVGGIVGLAMVFGLALLERMDQRDLPAPADSWKGPG